MGELWIFLATNYANFWLWLFGGAIGAWPYLAGVAVILSALVYFAVYMNFDKSTNLFVKTIGNLTGLAIALSMVITLGNIGGDIYKENFEDCVIMVGEFDLKPNATADLRSTYCRTRGHVDDDWDEFELINIETKLKKE